MTGTAPRQTGAFDLPDKGLVPVRIEVLPPGKGLVLIARTKPDDSAPLFALLIDGAGRCWPRPDRRRPSARARRPGRRGGLLVAFDRKPGAQGAEATYTVTPFDAGDPGARRQAAHVPHRSRGRAQDAARARDRVLRRVHADLGRAGRRLRQGRRRARPSQKTVIDALTGKTISEGEIPDLVGWEVTGQLRRDHPGQSLFVDLNQDGSGVDVIDAMGKKVPAALAAPFRLYDPKSLRVEEGPAPNSLTFGLAVDPLNPDAVKRRKPDLPMLDLYTADVVERRGHAARAGVHAPPRDLPDSCRHAGGAQAVQELRAGRR